MQPARQENPGQRPGPGPRQGATSMTTQTAAAVPVDAIDAALAAATPNLSEDEQRLAVAVFRLLAAGRAALHQPGHRPAVDRRAPRPLRDQPRRRIPAGPPPHPPHLRHRPSRLTRGRGKPGLDGLWLPPA